MQVSATCQGKARLSYPRGSRLWRRGDVETPALLHKLNLAWRMELAVQRPPKLMTHLQSLPNQAITAVVMHHGQCNFVMIIS